VTNVSSREFEKDAELSLDPDMAARSMKAYEDGDWQEIEDVIEELQSTASDDPGGRRCDDGPGTNPK